MMYLLFALCGSSLNGIHNIILSHIIRKKHNISAITLFLTDSLYPDFFTELNAMLEKSATQLKIEIPTLSHKIINGENLITIKSDISQILQSQNSPFILDITAGRKVMAVGAALAFQLSKVTEKLISYYLLKGTFNTYSKNRLIQNLLDDEWSLTYYKI